MLREDLLPSDTDGCVCLARVVGSNNELVQHGMFPLDRRLDVRGHYGLHPDTCKDLKSGDVRTAQERQALVQAHTCEELD